MPNISYRFHDKWRFRSKSQFFLPCPAEGSTWNFVKAGCSKHTWCPITDCQIVWRYVSLFWYNTITWRPYRQIIHTEKISVSRCTCWLATKLGEQCLLLYGIHQCRFTPCAIVLFKPCYLPPTRTVRFTRRLYRVSKIAQKVVDELWWIFWRGLLCHHVRTCIVSRRLKISPLKLQPYGAIEIRLLLLLSSFFLGPVAPSFLVVVVVVL